MTHVFLEVSVLYKAVLLPVVLPRLDGVDGPLGVGDDAAHVVRLVVRAGVVRPRRVRLQEQLDSIRGLCVQCPLPHFLRSTTVQNTHQFLFAQPLRPLSPVIEEVSAKARVTFRETVEEVAIVVAKVQQPSLFVLIDWLVVVVFTQVAFLESSKFNLSQIHILMLEFVCLFIC